MNDEERKELDKLWNEPPWSDEELDHHQRWLDEHGQSARPDDCPICKALVARDDPQVERFVKP